MKNYLLIGLGVAVLAVLLPAKAQARQPIIITDPVTGRTTTILPSRLQPGANVAIPGTGQAWSDPSSGAGGTRYLGVDGRWHGTTAFIDPATGRGQVVIYSARVPNGGGGPSSRQPSYSSPAPPSRIAPRRAPAPPR